METKTPIIWLLLDDRAGNRSQCIGVGEALVKEYGWSFESKNLSYNIFAKLPNFILGKGFKGIAAKSRAQLNPPWPDLVIAAGRRLAPVARQIKFKSAGCTKIVQIMDPGPIGREEFDLIAIPAHDAIDLASDVSNIMETMGSAHRITPERLESEKAQWQDKLAELPSPKIALIVGGSTKNRTFTAKMGKELGQMASEMALEAGGSLMISTSRRTSSVAIKALLAEIKSPSVVYKWGDGGDNPYFGYLGCSDAVIVTGDSMSMCSEACGTEGPVYIYAPEDLVTLKHQRLIRGLLETNFVEPLGESFTTGFRQTLNAAAPIAKQVKLLF